MSQLLADTEVLDLSEPSPATNIEPAAPSPIAVQSPAPEPKWVNETITANVLTGSTIVELRAEFNSDRAGQAAYFAVEKELRRPLREAAERYFRESDLVRQARSLEQSREKIEAAIASKEAELRNRIESARTSGDMTEFASATTDRANLVTWREGQQAAVDELGRELERVRKRIPRELEDAVRSAHEKVAAECRTELKAVIELALSALGSDATSIGRLAAVAATANTYFERNLALTYCIVPETFLTDEPS